MDIIITKADLVNALARVQGIVEKKNTVPILSSVLLEAYGSELAVSATDLELFLRSRYPVKIAKEGVVTAPAKKLFEIVRELPEGDVRLIAGDKGWLRIEMGRARFKVMSLPKDDFPALPAGQEGEKIELAPALLAEAIEKTAFAMSHDQTRQALNGILLEVSPVGGVVHDDEPDLPHQVNDAEVLPAAHLAINRSTPLWKIVDGVTHSWSVLDPLENAAITIRLPAAVTVERLAVWLTVSPGLAVAKDVVFEGDGKPLVTATLESKRGRQELPLPAPATFRELKLTVRSAYPGQNAWGSISEIEGFDHAGRNVLLAPPRYEPRVEPASVVAKYREIKAADPARPVFMTVTGNFHPHFDKWTGAQRSSLYPAYFQAADIIGYDIYPIYGWNKPEWIHLVHEATDLLAQQTGQRPLYAWIETSKGGQWTGALEKQQDVSPAHLRAEVWMAICRGATAIGYFTHVWKPSYHQFGVPDENRAALREINSQITRLAPAILSSQPAPAVTIAADGGVKLDVLARQHAGSLYLFAVNYDERATAAEATLTVPELAAGAEIEVLDERRVIRAEAGRFCDAFGPLAIRLYRVRR